MIILNASWIGMTPRTTSRKEECRFPCWKLQTSWQRFQKNSRVVDLVLTYIFKCWHRVWSFRFFAGFRGFWMAASDIGRTAGRFYWVNGSPVDKSTWYSGRLNQHGTGKETCAYLSIYTTELGEYTCSTKNSNLYILCEVPAASWVGVFLFDTFLVPQNSNFMHLAENL